MGEHTNEEILRTYLRALTENDVETLARLRDPGWTIEYPQSGELIRGHANERAIADNYPGGLPTIDPGRIVGSEDTWVVTPSFTLERIAGGGDAWWSEGRIYREISYWAEPFDPPAWRAGWVEPIEPHRPRASGRSSEVAGGGR